MPRREGGHRLKFRNPFPSNVVQKSSYSQVVFFFFFGLVLLFFSLRVTQRYHKALLDWKEAAKVLQGNNCAPVFCVLWSSNSYSAWLQSLPSQGYKTNG